jgi:drug/metabolite transporter (DMT)-like permease
MNTLALGLIAAMCWGFHDICIRLLSHKTPISACIFIVLLTGLIFQTVFTAVSGEIHTLKLRAIWPSLGAGIFFVIATYGLYYAFKRGPVRLVAPVIAGYPILSVGIAALIGNPTSATQWGAVAAIILGVAVVAAMSDTSSGDNPPFGPTILFATIAAFGFAGTFALGQYAANISHEIPTTFVTRVLSVSLTVMILLIFKQPFWPGKRALPLLIAMGVADGLALYCVLSAGALPDPQYAAVTASMFGLMTILLAWFFLKEHMTLLQWIGCIIAFCGVGVLAT